MLPLLLALAGCSPSLAPVDTPSPYEQAGAIYPEVIMASLDGKSCSGRTAAVVRLQEQLARTLEQVKPGDGERVLLYAVTANSLSQVQRFNAAGSPLTGDNGSLLHSAARFADAPLMDFLLSIGLGIEEHGGASASALFVAATSGRRDNTLWLIEHGADVNAVDTQGGSVLRHSLICRDQELLDLLVRNGAKADGRTIELANRHGMRL